MNIIDKIWHAHVVHHEQGFPAVIAVDCMLIHEVTSPQAFSMLREKNLPLAYPKSLIGTLDHSIPTRINRHKVTDKAAERQIDLFRNNVADFAVQSHDYGSGTQGIVHVIAPELGVVQPGSLLVCGDSHTSTLGAFGAFAFGIGISEVGHVMATSTLLQEKPKTMKVEFIGQLRPAVFAKDVILKLIATLGVGGANGYFIEYTGELVRGMSMEERMTLCNMSIECGARGGLIAPDATTFEYLRGRPHAPSEDLWEEAVAYWESFRSDPESTYDEELTIEIGSLQPMVTWGTTPAQAIQIGDPLVFSSEQRQAARKALEYTGVVEGAPIEGTPIQWAFLGTCTNGRISDLRIAASILEGRHVAHGVTFLIVPGSEQVRQQAIEEGLDQIFQAAGAQFRMPGCSMCLAMNDDKVPSGARCISSSNRNFIGRQGTGSITHLGSPATVTASAVAGTIVSPLPYLHSVPTASHYDTHSSHS